MIVDYECGKGHVSERFMPTSDTPPIPCMVCGNVSKRIFSIGTLRHHVDFDSDVRDMGHGTYFKSAYERDETSKRKGYRRLKSWEDGGTDG